MRMSLISKAVRTLKEDGFRKFVKKSGRYVINTLDPRPTVTNGSPPLPVWYLKHVYNLMFTLRYGSGVDVVEEDWDTLILLDACRYDDFKDLNTIPGKMDFKISQGVDSDEFIRKNFVDRDLSDTVYVTANPHVGLIGENTFYDIITDPISNWNLELQCIPPEEVTSPAIKAHEQYPNKRIIVHYMQPHDPPLGPTAEELRKKSNIGGAAPDENSSQGERIMELVASGEISEERAHDAYRETLDIVLSQVGDLLNRIEGKVVVSADHGEMFGECPYLLLGDLYEHYQNPKTVQLCKVPWFVVEPANDRRKISSSEGAHDGADISEDGLNEQLRALGYK